MDLTKDLNNSKKHLASLLPNAFNNGCDFVCKLSLLYKLGVTDYGIYNAVGRYGSGRTEVVIVGKW